MNPPLAKHAANGEGAENGRCRRRDDRGVNEMSEWEGERAGSGMEEEVGRLMVKTERERQLGSKANGVVTGNGRSRQ